MIAENYLGCRDTTFRNIYIRPELHVFVPNAFTPDGDEFNKVFTTVVTGVNPFNYSFTVYDRWGETLFVSKDPRSGRMELMTIVTYLLEFMCGNYTLKMKMEFGKSIMVM